MCYAAPLCHCIHCYHCVGSTQVCQRDAGGGSGHVHPVLPLHAQVDAVRESKAPIHSDKRCKEQHIERANIFILRSECTEAGAADTVQIRSS